MADSKLTARQQRFIEEYLIDPNGTQAAIKAGYSEKTAEQIGYQLLQKTSVSEAIKAGQEKRANDLGLDAKWVLTRLKEISDKCMRPILVTDREGNPIGERIDASGANKATELIGKHLGMFTEKVDLNVTKSHEDALEELE